MLTHTWRNILFISFLLAICLPAISYGQGVYDGQVINKSTELVIPGVSVILLKEKTGTQTNEQGYFNLASSNKIPNDTLEFSSVGYKTFRLSVTGYQKRMFITLEPSNTQLNQVNIGDGKLRELVLEKFTYSDIKTVYSPGYTHITASFSTRSAYAKLFEAPQDNVLLESIQLGRRDDDIPRGNAFPLTTVSKNTTFLLHVMAVDPKTGAPGNILFTKQIILSDKAQLVTINLAKDKLVIPTTKFFIAIEWLHVPFNEVVKLGIGGKVDKVRKDGSQRFQDESLYTVRYQPFLIGYAQAKRAPAWIYIDNTWIRYIDPANEIALSATIHY